MSGRVTQARQGVMEALCMRLHLASTLMGVTYLPWQPWQLIHMAANPSMHAGLRRARGPGWGATPTSPLT